METTSRIAAVYEVHGNLPALEAVLSDLEDIDHGLIVGGGCPLVRPRTACIRLVRFPDRGSSPRPDGFLRRANPGRDRRAWHRLVLPRHPEQRRGHPHDGHAGHI